MGWYKEASLNIDGLDNLMFLHGYQFVGQTWAPKDIFQRKRVSQMLVLLNNLYQAMSNVDLTQIPNRAFLESCKKICYQELRYCNEYQFKDQIQFIFHMSSFMRASKRFMEYTKRLIDIGTIPDTFDVKRHYTQTNIE
jgi:hypothetical protein